MKLSILNLAPVREGQTYLQAVESMVSLAKHAENIGIERYWIAEHHNMKNLVSSATALLIQHTLANTKTLRVGSGGVMLPNHSPYVVAEQYGTLETLYPNRVELGFRACTRNGYANGCGTSSWTKQPRFPCGNCGTSRLL